VTGLIVLSPSLGAAGLAGDAITDEVIAGNERVIEAIVTDGVLKRSARCWRLGLEVESCQLSWSRNVKHTRNE
jgi:hypothetical protein